MSTNPVDEPAAAAAPPLSLLAFAKSLFHGERADNYFKFLTNLPEDELATFLQDLLREVGDAVDERQAPALAHFVQQRQVQAYAGTQVPSAVRPDLPPVPLVPLGKPLREATVAIFTSGAVYRDDQEPFYPAHLTYDQALHDATSARERAASLRVIPAATPEARLRVGHIAYDIRAAQKDINVIFPLTRMHELAAQGVIGAVAERNYSYHGLTNIGRLRDETAPQWAQMLRADGVDAVFLTPG